MAFHDARPVGRRFGRLPSGSHRVELVAGVYAVKRPLFAVLLGVRLAVGREKLLICAGRKLGGERLANVVIHQIHSRVIINFHAILVDNFLFFPPCRFGL